MKHFLVTRFNIKEKGWKTTRLGEPVLTEEWLNHRLILFETYCLPSVKNQTNRQFTWCVFFDINTPDFIRRRIEFIAKNNPMFHPIYVKGASEMEDCLKKEILRKVKDQKEYVITSRLDNDDLLHKDFVRTIQELYRPEEKTVIDITKGFQLNIANGRFELRKINSRLNPFISVVERADNMETVISRRHTDWADANSIVEYSGKELWIELIHEKNKLNTVNTSAKKVHKINFPDFGISSWPAGFANFFQITISNFILGIMNFFSLLKRNLKRFF